MKKSDNRISSEGPKICISNNPRGCFFINGQHSPTMRAPFAETLPLFCLAWLAEYSKLMNRIESAHTWTVVGAVNKAVSRTVSRAISWAICWVVGGAVGWVVGQAACGPSIGLSVGS